MFSASPKSGERFYLRMRLTVVRGATCFEDLRRVNGILYPTFRDACIADGMLEDDGEWAACLQEASVMQTGRTLRNLFCTILQHNSPTRPEHLWNQFKAFICDDLQHYLQVRNIRPNATEDDAFDYGLYLIQESLARAGVALHTIAPEMPHVLQAWTAPDENPLIRRQQVDNVASLETYVNENTPRLNPQQMAAFNAICTSVRNAQGKLFFLHGPGGTGKTFVYKVVTNALRLENSIVLCVASSGIAALLLPIGATAHSTFKIPIILHNASKCSITRHTCEADLMKKVRLIIWDEAGMMHRHAFEAVDRMLQDIRDNDAPFGGVTVVLGGDFQQTLPVIPKGRPEDIVQACITKSILWQHFEVLHLTQNMRLENNDDPQVANFASWLLDIGHGRNQPIDGGIKLPDHMRAGPNGTLDDLINNIYPALASVNPAGANEDTYFADRMILSPRNDDVHAINKTVLGMVPGMEKVYRSADSVVTEAGADGHHHAPVPADDDAVHEAVDPVPVEFLNNLQPNGLPIHELRLKIGVPILILRNLSVENGLCNGTRAIVLQLTNRVIKVRILGGDHAGEIAFIPRLNLTPSNESKSA